MTNDAPDQDNMAGTRPAVVLIAGPTASGKSAMALRIAERLDGTVINADASQVYRDLSILTARPDAGDMERAPHLLFGHVDAAEACSAARWAAEAREAITATHAAGRVPVLAGGTGLYIRTLIDGIAPVPAIDAAVRAEVRALPVAVAYEALLREDAAAAARLNPADSTRVARALEVVRSTGRPIADWQRARTGGIGERVTLHPLLLLPDRDWLTARCADRFAAMIDAGAVAEVEALMARGLDPALPAMRAIGVPPIMSWLGGECDRDTMMTRAIMDTRRYAKRQYTWFRNQPPSDWPRIGTTEYEDLLQKIVIKLQQKDLT